MSAAGGHALLTDRGNLKRRKRFNRVVEVASTIAALLAVAVLLLVVGSVLLKGLGALSLHFLTTPTGLFGDTSGGISNAIVGSAIMVGLAALMAIPVGLLVAIYTTEFASARFGHAVRFVLDILNGVPTIITGIFVFGLLVEGNKQSGFAASVALAIIMLPIVARTAQEVLTLVPEQPQGGRACARRRPLARDRPHHHPDRGRRPDHRRPARRRPGRRRDRAADPALLDLRPGRAHRTG